MSEFDEAYELKVQQDALRQRRHDMASRRQVQTESVDETTGEVHAQTQAANSDALPDDDLPDSYDDEGNHASSAMPTATPGMGLDKLRGLGFTNDEQYASDRKKLDLPRGDWFKKDRWEAKTFVFKGDCMPGDIDPEGRTMIYVTGKPEPRFVDDTEYTPEFTIRMSPDRRMHREKTNEFDNAYKLFLKARDDVYLEIHQCKARDFSEFIAMLEEDDYVLGALSGDSGPIVTQIKARSFSSKRR